VTCSALVLGDGDCLACVAAAAPIDPAARAAWKAALIDRQAA